MEEIWKKIIGHPKYEISNLGRIKSYTKLGKVRLLNPKQTGSGREAINLDKKSYMIDILVARTFIPNPLNKEHVYHKNMIFNDSCVDNLMWVDLLEYEQLVAKNNIPKLDDGEEWRHIRGYDGYEVSNYGRVRSVDRIVQLSNGSIRYTKGKILSIRHTTNIHSGIKARWSVRILEKHLLIDLLVAEAFIPNPDNKPHIHHTNFDINDNSLNNLIWVTFEELKELYILKSIDDDNNNWEFIDGYDYYKISRTGQIKSIRHPVMRSHNEVLYQEESIYMASRGRVIEKHESLGNKNTDIGVLMAKTFIPNPNNKPYVLNLDLDSSNVSIDNLKWVTFEEARDHCRNVKFVESMDGEIWRVHSNKNYEVSNLGRVRTISRPYTCSYYTEHKLNYVKSSLMAICTSDERPYCGGIGSLSKAIALAFVPNPKDKMHTRLIDKSRGYMASNIEWC